MTTTICKRCGGKFTHDKRFAHYCPPCVYLNSLDHQAKNRRSTATKAASNPGFDFKGLDALAIRSCQEVADIMGISKSRVQQIEVAALTKLRRALAAYA